MSENKNSMNRLYDKLFDTMDNITDDPKSIAKAKAVVEVSDAIVNVAKLEHNVAKAYGGEYKHTMSKPKQIPMPKDNEPRQLESKEMAIEFITADTPEELRTICQEFEEENKHRSPELIYVTKNSLGKREAKYRMVKQ
jgi:hypothetical protein